MFRKLKYILLSSVILFVGVQNASSQRVAVKTNALMIAAGTPNAGCEFVVGDRSSMDISVFGNYKPYGTDIKMIGIQPEYRFWFNGRPMVREYLGIAALGVNYDITWKKNIYKGDAAGIGITMGYSILLGEHCNVEFYGGFGAICFQQKQYYISDNFKDYTTNGLGRANAHGYKLLPIKLGVSFSYIIK